MKRTRRLEEEKKDCSIPCDTVYLWDAKVSKYQYGDPCMHPMKPLRLQLVHELLRASGIVEQIRVLTPPPIPKARLSQYHSPKYIDFLHHANHHDPDRAAVATLTTGASVSSRAFHFSSDCPAFQGVFDFSSAAASGSVAGAVLLNHRYTSVAINWSGGLHHAKRVEPSGFCYINDVVLAITELLRTYRRVLYVDIDVHHGDGVEEAFYCTDRVMTFSMHRGGNFFPGTGRRDDIGMEQGRGYSINVPLFDGVTDTQYYFSLFRPLFRSVMEHFQPSVIVLQCGADSLVGDRIGTFNVSSTAHLLCVQYVRSFCCPMLVLGGGGYTVTNVAKTWTLETAYLCGLPIAEHEPIPPHVYSSLYGEKATYHIAAQAWRSNDNTTAYVEQLLAHHLTLLRKLGTPNVVDNTILYQTPRSNPYRGAVRVEASSSDLGNVLDTRVWDPSDGVPWNVDDAFLSQNDEEDLDEL